VVAVADAGSFTLAAMQLRVAQQAVSRQIADLEGELGVKLFDRGARGANLTTAGASFVAEARQLLEGAARAARRARAEAVAQHLAVGYSYLVPEHLERVNAAVAALEGACPEVLVEMRQVPTGQQEAALRKREVDVAFGYLTSPDVGDIASEVLAGNAITGVLLPRSHPMAGAGLIRLRELAAWPLIVIPREVNPAAIDACLIGLAARGLRPELANVRTVGSSAMAMVASGQGWHLASRAMARQFAGEAGVVYLPFSDPPLPFGLGVRWLRDGAGPAARALVASCREHRDPAADFLSDR
jgi:DNA-binding transcriptional LysR family regulator